MTKIKEFKTWYAFESCNEEEIHSKCYFVRPAGKKRKLQIIVNAREKFKNNIFQYDNLRFTQLGGTAMETQLAPVLAAIYVRDLEENFA